MPTLRVDPHVPLIAPTESLTGWRGGFCVELLGDAIARIFERVVEQSSQKASDLQRGVLFCHLDPRFTDPGCVEAIRGDLIGWSTSRNEFAGSRRPSGDRTGTDVPRYVAVNGAKPRAATTRTRRGGSLMVI
jgi:hypothetical protein